MARPAGDGVDDYDYLTLLQRRAPDHPLLRRLRDAGRGAYDSPQVLLQSREALAQALEGLRGL